MLRKKKIAVCSEIHTKHIKIPCDHNIHGVSGGIVNILGGGSMDYSEQISFVQTCVQFSMGVKIQLFEVGAYRSDFYLWGWMKSGDCKEKVNTRDELVARIMNSAALLKQERQDDLRRATRTVVKRVEKCIEVDGWIFEHLL